MMAEQKAKDKTTIKVEWLVLNAEIASMVGRSVRSCDSFLIRRRNDNLH
jgi:hypothetical protein